MENQETKEVKIEGVRKIREISIQMSILIGSIIIASAILVGFSWIKTSNPIVQKENSISGFKKIDSKDIILGNSKAKVSLVLYEDFQCPFCGKFFKENELSLRDKYVSTGKLSLVYRDFAFLGPESLRSAEATHCAKDQNKYWEFHDYLFTHQNGENKGAFSDANLKSFASSLGLDTASFNTCFDSKKYESLVIDSTKAGSAAGVNGTPKGFIVKDGKVFDTIDGAESIDKVTAKIEAALK